MLEILYKTLPFFALVGLGYWAAWVRFFPAEATAWLTKFVFYFALSAMLFRFAANLIVRTCSHLKLQGPFAVQPSREGNSLIIQRVATEHEDFARLGEVAGDYLWQGFIHILMGWDHLAFVLCLCLLTQGRTLLLTTHFMDEAERLCSRLLVLDHGKKIAEGHPKELIAQHLEPDVVEVYGVGALALAESAEHTGLRALAARVEVSGETVFFYTQDARPLLDRLAAHSHLRTLHRPANLEDLFLKLTGRQIREDA